MIRASRWPFVTTLVGFVGAVALVTVYSVWRMREEQLVNGFALSALVSRNVETLVTHSLLSLQQIASGALADLPADADADRILGRLSPGLRHIPFLRSISVLDGHGTIVASTNPGNVGHAVDTRPYLPAAQPQSNLMRVGQPWVGRDFADGRIAASHESGDERLAGFVAVERTLGGNPNCSAVLFALNSDYFVSRMSLSMGTIPGAISLVRLDGIVLVTTDDFKGPGLVDSGAARAIGPAEVDSSQAEEDLGGDRHTLAAFKSSHAFPLLVATRLDRDKTLQHWATEVRTLAMVELSLLVAVVVVSIWLYRRRLQLELQRAQLQQQQRLHAEVFSARHEGLFIADAQGTILAVNPAFARITGFQATEVVGKHLTSLVLVHDRDEVVTRVRDAVTREGHWQGDLTSRRKDGTSFDARISFSVSTDEHGQVEHYIGDLSDVTDVRRAQQALEASEERFRSLTQLSSDWYWEQDDQYRFIDMRGDLELKTGIPVDAHLGLRRWDMPALNMTASDWDAHKAVLNAHLPFHGLEMRRPDKNGREHWVSISGTPKFDAAGRFTGYRGIGTDITERKRTEADLRLAASVFSHSHEAILITDVRGTILDVNEAFTRITGYGRQEVLGRNPSLLASGDHGAEFYAAFWHSLTQDGTWQGEIWNRRKSGERYAETLTVSAVRDPSGRTLHYVALFSDITSSKEHQRKLDYIAHYDALTALPNRLLLADRLQQALAQARRRSIGIAVAFVDLDGFKAVNDTHGHGIGDGLLTALAKRMKQTLRQGDTLARVGGDEFVAVLADLQDCATAAPVLDRLLAAASEVVVIDGISLSVSASIGVVFSHQHQAHEAEHLLRQADQAMYQAKLLGKNRIHVFEGPSGPPPIGAPERGEGESPYQPTGRD